MPKKKKNRHESLPHTPNQAPSTARYIMFGLAQNKLANSDIAKSKKNNFTSAHRTEAPTSAPPAMPTVIGTPRDYRDSPSFIARQNAQRKRQLDEAKKPSFTSVAVDGGGFEDVVKGVKEQVAHKAKAVGHKDDAQRTTLESGDNENAAIAKDATKKKKRKSKKTSTGAPVQAYNQWNGVDNDHEQTTELPHRSRSPVNTAGSTIDSQGFQKENYKMKPTKNLKQPKSTAPGPSQPSWIKNNLNSGTDASDASSTSSSSSSHAASTKSKASRAFVQSAKSARSQTDFQDQLNDTDDGSSSTSASTDEPELDNATDQSHTAAADGVMDIDNKSDSEDEDDGSDANTSSDSDSSSGSEPATQHSNKRKHNAAFSSSDDPDQDAQPTKLPKSSVATRNPPPADLPTATVSAALTSPTYPKSVLTAVGSLESILPSCIATINSAITNPPDAGAGAGELNLRQLLPAQDADRTTRLTTILTSAKEVLVRLSTKYTTDVASNGMGGGNQKLLSDLARIAKEREDRIEVLKGKVRWLRESTERAANGKREGKRRGRKKR